MRWVSRERHAQTGDETVITPLSGARGEQDARGPALYPPSCRWLWDRHVSSHRTDLDISHSLRVAHGAPELQALAAIRSQCNECSWRWVRFTASWRQLYDPTQ
jgi:hypothetical protein